MDRVASKIVTRMMLANLISEDEVEEYNYAILILLEKMISFLTIMSFAILLNHVLEIALFVVSFSLIRKYSGGIHCQGFGTCLIASTAVSLSVVVALPLVEKSILTYQGG